jgi:hypothetical protein
VSKPQRPPVLNVQWERCNPGKRLQFCCEVTFGRAVHETYSDLSLCSMAVPVVVHGAAQRVPVAMPPVEKKVADLHR